MGTSGIILSTFWVSIRIRLDCGLRGSQEHMLFSLIDWALYSILVYSTVDVGSTQLAILRDSSLATRLRITDFSDSFEKRWRVGCAPDKLTITNIIYYVQKC